MDRHYSAEPSSFPFNFIDTDFQDLQILLKLLLLRTVTFYLCRINSKKMKMEELVAIAQPSNHNESGELAIPQSNSNPHNTVVPQSSLPQNITDMNTTGAQNIPRESSSSGVYQASGKSFFSALVYLFYVWIFLGLLYL